MLTYTMPVQISNTFEVIPAHLPERFKVKLVIQDYRQDL